MAFNLIDISRHVYVVREPIIKIGEPSAVATTVQVANHVLHAGWPGCGGTIDHSRSYTKRYSQVYRLEWDTGETWI